MARNQQDILVKIRVLLEGLGNVRALAGHLKEMNGGGGRGGQAVALAGDIDKLSAAVDRLAAAQDKASSKGSFVRLLVGVSAVVNTLSNIPQAFAGIDKLLDFFDSIGGSVGAAVGKVKEFGSSLFSSVSQFASGAGAQAGAAVSGLGGAVSGLGAALGAALPFIAAAGLALAALLAVVAPLGVAMTGLAAAVAVGLGALLKIAPAGLAANRQLEQVRLGIAAVITSLAELKVNGVPVDGAEKFRVAMQVAGDQLAKLRVDAVNTVATFEQIAPAFQAALGPGLAARLTLDQIREITVKVVQAAGAIGLPLHQVNQEVRAILEGTINEDARLAKVLGISNEMVKSWKAQGTLAEELNKRLAGFAVAGAEAAQTLDGLTSNLQEALNVFSAEATARAFNALKEEFARLLPQLFDFRSAGIAAQFKTLAQLADEVLTRVVRIGGSIAQGIVSGLKRASDFVSQNKTTVNDILNLVELVVRQLLQGAGVLARVATDTGTWKGLLEGVRGVLVLINVALDVMVGLLRQAEPLLRLAALAGAAVIAANPSLGALAGTAPGGAAAGANQQDLDAEMERLRSKQRGSVTVTGLPRVGGGGGKGGGGGRQSQVRELTRALEEARIEAALAEAQARFEAIRQEVEASVGAIRSGLDDAITSISEAYRLEAAFADKALKAEQDRIDAEINAAKARRDLAVKSLDPKLTAEERRLAIAAEDTKLLTETVRLEAERKRIVNETADRKAALVRDEAEANRQLEQTLADVENQLDAMSRSSAVRAEAAAREIEARFEETRRQLVANFGEASEQVRALDKLIRGLTERAKFDELTGNVEAKFGELRDLVELLSVGVESGQIRAKDATRRRVELEREYKRVLLDEIEGLAEIARRTGDPALLAAVRQLQIEWAKLGQVIDETAKRIDDTLRRGLEDTLANIIMRTETVGEAFRKLAQTILAEIARILAANFVEKLFGGGLNTGSGNSIGNILAKILGGGTTTTSGGGRGQRPGAGIENIPLIIRNFQSGTLSGLSGISEGTRKLTDTAGRGFLDVVTSFGTLFGQVSGLDVSLKIIVAKLIAEDVKKVADTVIKVAQAFFSSSAAASATGSFQTAAPGGRLVRVAEAGFDEVILTTDPKHRGRTSRLLGQFLRRTGLAPDFGAVVLEGALAGVPSFAAGGFALEGVNPPAQIGGDTFNVTTYATIQTTTPQAFRGSEAAIERDLSRMTLRGIRRAKSQPGK